MNLGVRVVFHILHTSQCRNIHMKMKLNKVINFSIDSDSNKENVNNSQSQSDMFNKICNFETPREMEDLTKNQLTAGGTSVTRFCSGIQKILKSKKGKVEGFLGNQEIEEKNSPQVMDIQIPKFDITSNDDIHENEEDSYKLNKIS